LWKNRPGKAGKGRYIKGFRGTGAKKRRREFHFKLGPLERKSAAFFRFWDDFTRGRKRV